MSPTTAMLALAMLFAASACSEDEPPALSGAGGTGGDGAASTGGSVGGGGGSPCGGCGGTTPLCDGTSCVACLADGDCTDPAAAKCDAGSCVACDDSAQCAGITGTEVCAAGTCVECALGEEDACTGGETCDLVAGECVAVGPGSVQNCGACTNDVQCTAGHRCIPMDFEGSHHGYYCLREFTAPDCEKPFSVGMLDVPSIGGAAPADYCGINDDLATCEAVVALQGDWRCSGIDGMCSPDGIAPEIAVPGALCRTVGATLPNRCTYACAGGSECLDPPTAGNTCGIGTPPTAAPEWCGG